MRRRLNDVIRLFVSTENRCFFQSVVLRCLTDCEKSWSELQCMGQQRSNWCCRKPNSGRSISHSWPSALNYCWSRHWQWTIDVARSDGSSSLAADEEWNWNSGEATLPGYLEAIVSKWGKIQPQTTSSEEYLRLRPVGQIVSSMSRCSPQPASGWVDNKPISWVSYSWSCSSPYQLAHCAILANYFGVEVMLWIYFMDC